MYSCFPCSIFVFSRFLSRSSLYKNYDYECKTISYELGLLKYIFMRLPLQNIGVGTADNVRSDHHIVFDPDA